MERREGTNEKKKRRKAGWNSRRRPSRRLLWCASDSRAGSRRGNINSGRGDRSSRGTSGECQMHPSFGSGSRTPWPGEGGSSSRWIASEGFPAASSPPPTNVERQSGTGPASQAIRLRILPTLTLSTSLYFLKRPNLAFPTLSSTEYKIQESIFKVPR